MKVLTIKTDGWTYEIHMLNVGEVLDNFGGSKHPLIAGRDYYTGEKHKKPTASLVVRSSSKMGSEDREYDINDKRVWNWIAFLINEGDVSATSFGPHLIDRGAQQTKSGG